MPWMILSSLGAKPHCCSYYDVSTSVTPGMIYQRFSIITHFMRMLFIFAHFFRWLTTGILCPKFLCVFFVIVFCVFFGKVAPCYTSRC